MFRQVCLAFYLLLGLATAVAAQSTKPSAPAKNVPIQKVGEHGTYADYRSQHFFMHTDLKPDEVAELFTRLETMLGIISEYWAAPPRGVIEMYVVKDLKNWPAGVLDPDGRFMIEGGGGLTITQTLGYGIGGQSRVVDAKSVVYAGAERGTPQHEAVHAYCGQTFGTTGPVWYSEGMAEMGNYWRKGEKDVQVFPVVIKHLRTSEIKTLNEIVNSEERTGDSWENYAWRWALCHMLANNTNYAKDFRPLGLAILKRERGVSFESVYGDRAAEISFEYQFFIENVFNGYRVDLCSWEWHKKFAVTRGTTAQSSKILADHGWQGSQATVNADKEYEYTTTGTWQLSPDGEKLTAHGDKDGKGRLLGVIFKDYKLSEPFELDAAGTFKPPMSGDLFLRCNEYLHEIADNKGAITFRIKMKAKQ